MPKFHGRKAGAKSTPCKAIRYVLNEKKTLAYDTIGLTDDRPYSQQFREVAMMQGSEYSFDERKYYHYKLSFEEEDWDIKGGPITTEKALEIGKKFCEKHFSGFDAVLSVHGDTDNLHVHIVLNAFSSEYEQNKIHVNEEQYAGFKDWAYDIGKEYGLTEKHWRLETVEKREKQRQERENQQSTEPINLSNGEKTILNELDKKGRAKDFGDYSWKEQYRIAIDEAKRETTNFDSFRDYLKENFHIDTQVTKYGNIKYKMPERRTYSSGKALGSDYELPAVERALAETKNRPSDLPKPSESEVLVYNWHEKFEEEYAKFQNWQEGEYQEQRGDWLNEDAGAGDYRDNAVLEKTEALYKHCIEVENNEALAALLSDKQKAEILELKHYRERLRLQEKEDDKRVALLQRYEDFWEFRRQMQMKYREDLSDTFDYRRDTRGTFYDAMRVLHNSDSILVKIIAAGVALHAIKKEQRINQQIEELKHERDTFARNTTDYETFVRAYGSELQAGKLPGSEYMDNVARTYRAFEREERRQQYINTLQTTGTSIADRLTAAQGIQRMNVEEGRKSRENELYKAYGRDTRVRGGISVRKDWRVQAAYDVIRVARELGASNATELELKVKQEGREYGKIKREYTSAKKQYDEAVNAATSELSQDSSLSVEERIVKLEEIKAAEYEKIRGISEKFLEAKDHYKDCARALETLKGEQDKQTFYATPEQSQEEKQEEAPRRSKAEAQRETNKQWAEIRDWSDEAVKAVASMPETSKEADLQNWAKEMEKHGCQVRITANKVSVTHPESNQAVRTNRLGGAYEKEAIENGIQLVRSKARSRTEASKQSERNSGTPQRDSRAQGVGRTLDRERRKEIER